MTDYIGTGLSTEMNLTGRSDFERLSGASLLDNSIITLLSTKAANDGTRRGGERIYNRGIGINLAQFLFRADALDLRQEVVEEIRKIEEFEPRIILTTIEVASDKELRPAGFVAGLFIVKISYTIISTGEQRNLVVPILTTDNYYQIVRKETLVNGAAIS